jgi:hypothetical protein
MVACMITLFLQKRYKLLEDGPYDLNARYMFEYNTNDAVANTTRRFTYSDLRLVAKTAFSDLRLVAKNF